MSSSKEQRAARLTAYVLGELSVDEGAQVEAELDSVPEQQVVCDELREVSAELRLGRSDDAAGEPSADLRAVVLDRLARRNGTVTLPDSRKPTARSWRRWAAVLSVSAALLVLAIPLQQVLTRQSRALKISQLTATNQRLRAEQQWADDRFAIEQGARRTSLAGLQSRLDKVEDRQVVSGHESSFVMKDGAVTSSAAVATIEVAESERGESLAVKNRIPESAPTTQFQAQALTAERAQIAEITEQQEQLRELSALADQQQTQAHVNRTTAPAKRIWDQKGAGVAHSAATLAAQAGRQPTYNTPYVQPYYRQKSDLAWRTTELGWEDGYWELDFQSRGKQIAAAGESKAGHWAYTPATQEKAPDTVNGVAFGRNKVFMPAYGITNEQYAPIVENRFAAVANKPVSTFSIDVDTASYANVRRFLSNKQLPPPNAVRLEELINYFSYDYPAPKGNEPFSVSMEVAQCPWQPLHQIVRVGLKGKDVPRKERPASNLVFLLDVSGSMQDENKLPLLKRAMKLLTDQLTENDRVTIATYANDAGLALDSTNGESKETIHDAIDALKADGSTNGGAGIQLAYEKATACFIKDGANRVILATDGDLNVGVTDDDELVKLITDKAKSGVFLTVLGFGEGNLKDGKLEKLADNGNGMYAYVDSFREARKILVEQITGSLVTIAKDVKLKVEFNPAEVAAYRLLGYENRLMTSVEFNDDKKDAGEIGAGHTVTALYEIVPKAATQNVNTVTGDLKYQQEAKPVEPPKELTEAAKTGELLTLSLRFKQPDEDESTLRDFALKNDKRAFDDASIDFRFAASVASFGMQLRQSKYRGSTSFAAIEETAASAIGEDSHGHRTEFVDMVRHAGELVGKGGE